jgi:hypothetical protein
VTLSRETLARLINYAATYVASRKL